MREETDYTSPSEHYFNYIAERNKLAGDKDYSDPEQTNQRHGRGDYERLKDANLSSLNVATIKGGMDNVEEFDEFDQNLLKVRIKDRPDLDFRKPGQLPTMLDEEDEKGDIILGEKEFIQFEINKALGQIKEQKDKDKTELEKSVEEYKKSPFELQKAGKQDLRKLKDLKSKAKSM